MKKTIRDEFALAFISAVLTTPERLGDYIDEDDMMAAIAKDAYIMADSMVAARKSPE